MQGNITVEAAFVMPIVILTIFTLIYLSFQLHDRCRIQGTMNKVLHKKSFAIKHESDVVTGVVDYENINERGVFNFFLRDKQLENSKLEQHLNIELNKGLFLYKIEDIKAEIGDFQITLEVKARANIKLPIFSGLVNRNSYARFYSSMPIHSPAETIRSAEVILETGSSIKGFEELKNTLEKVFD